MKYFKEIFFCLQRTFVLNSGIREFGNSGIRDLSTDTLKIILYYLMLPARWLGGFYHHDRLPVYNRHKSLLIIRLSLAVLLLT
jgi:hypothetical protein